LVTRRRFISLLVESAAFLGILRVASFMRLGLAQVLRPPGAVEEEEFNTLCIRCGICQSICPTRIIALTGLEQGIEGLNTPKIDVSRGYCEFMRGRCEEAMLCGARCPTGALRNVHGDDVKIGTLRFEESLCLAYQGKECLVCDESCPITEAITLTDDLKPVFHDEKCVGCGTCVYSCPTSPKALELLPNGVRRAGSRSRGP